MKASPVPVNRKPAKNMNKKYTKLPRKTWDDPWFLALPPVGKLTVDFLRNHVDAAGVWEFDRTRLEIKMGFGKESPMWIHPGIRGIEFRTAELAEEDARARELDPKKIRMKPIISWASVVAAINKTPEGDENFVKPLHIIGEGIWWYPRKFVEEGGRLTPEGKITFALDENKPGRQERAVKLLLHYGILEQLRALYPRAVILDKYGPRNASPRSIPTLQDILDAPEGGAMSSEEKRRFWLSNNDEGWQSKDYWRKNLELWAERSAIRYRFTAMYEKPWPETSRQRQSTLGEIETLIEQENLSRNEGKLSKESMDSIKFLMFVREEIKKEIT